MSNLTTIESANGSKFDSVCEISTVSADNVTVTSTCKNFEYDKPVFQLTVIESVSQTYRKLTVSKTVCIMPPPPPSFCDR